MQKTRHGKSIRLILLIVLLLNAAGLGPITAQTPADSALITPRRVVLIRSAALTKEFPNSKRAVVRYPLVKGLDNGPVLRKVQLLLSVKNAFDSTIKDYREDTWLSEFDYKVGYNRNFLLDLTFWQDGVGAYPDTQTKHYLVDLKSGEVIKAGDAFLPDQLPKLITMVDGKLQAEIRTIIRGLSNDKDTNAEEKESLKSSFDELRFKEEDLNDFSVSDRGITFLFDAGFPHVIEALEPKGRYFFSFAQLQPYLRSDGPLAVFRTGK
jgi:hypothetical protein